MKKLRPLLAGLLLAAPLATASPRMISFEYPNCYSCHVAVQGRGLLNARGRGIDIEQSYSELDATAALLGALVNPEFNDGSWDGNFGPVLADFVATGRYTHLLDGSKDDTTLAALYRQIIFFGSDKKVRINTELGFRDSGLNDLQLGPSITALGGDPFFLKKLTLDWRFHSKKGGGSELSIGRDYLPLGLQIDDPSAYILSLNRNGVYDYPLQAKYFMWRRRWLAAITAFTPSFDEQISATREFGAGTMFEYSPNVTNWSLASKASPDSPNRLTATASAHTFAGASLKSGHCSPRPTSHIFPKPMPRMTAETRSHPSSNSSTTIGNGSSPASL